VIGLDLRVAVVYRMYAFSFLERVGFSYLQPPVACFFTYKKGGIVRGFLLSRLTFIDFVGKGFLPGVRKSSW
jgi:ribosomal protein S14